MKPSKVKLPKAKGPTEEVLPSRFAMAQITGGDPIYRSMNNYAKKTPADASGVMNFKLTRLLGGR